MPVKPPGVEEGEEVMGMRRGSLRELQEEPQMPVESPAGCSQHGGVLLGGM